tara:strand:+ start:203 stop:526 length:324 start_codon:yes stop_codon:yes gene_type:complete
MNSNLYKLSTDPDTEYLTLIKNPEVYMSILIHTILYILTIIVITKIIFKISLDNSVLYRIVFFLIVVMFFGYIGRLARSKNLMKTFKNKKIVKNMIDNAYIQWYFLS